VIYKDSRWLLLLHQLPPTPPYLRAKVLRRLKQAGALALKNSAYVLPDREECLEDLQWLTGEIRSDGGEAWLFRTEAVAGWSDEAIRAAFQEMRSADYRELLGEAQSIEAAIRSSGVTGDETRLRRLRKSFNEVARIDFFEAPGKQEVANLMLEIEKSLQPQVQTTEGLETSHPQLSGRRWVTRQGIKVDRMACSWLIRGFIDPAAELFFVDPNQYRHQDGELRFDMFEGEYTHQGDLCSFETLLQSFELHARSLRVIAEIVHDLDLKDGKFGRPEADGIALLIEGICLRNAKDEDRLDHALAMFDALHARLSTEQRKGDQP
jgi:hypothetical protein